MRWRQSGIKRRDYSKSCGNDMVRFIAVDWNGADNCRHSITHLDKRDSTRLPHSRQQESRFCQTRQNAEISKPVGGKEREGVRVPCTLSIPL